MADESDTPTPPQSAPATPRRRAARKPATPKSATGKAPAKSADAAAEAAPKPPASARAAADGRIKPVRGGWMLR